jgi:threonine/homoserine/homoserine lactone efflux protein
MDFLLILLSFGGLVVAFVMLVFAARASRMQRESDARVQTLESWATGSVLFASGAPAESDAEEAGSRSFDPILERNRT